MSPANHRDEIELLPNIGWQSVRLGESQAEVQAALKQMGIACPGSDCDERWSCSRQWHAGY
jgi:hypothetical protein